MPGLLPSIAETVQGTPSTRTVVGASAPRPKYRPDGDQLSALLTPRQQEVLRTVLDEGYYDTPRWTSQEAVASGPRVSPGTVDETSGR